MIKPEEQEEEDEDEEEEDEDVKEPDERAYTCRWTRKYKNQSCDLKLKHLS